MSVEKSCHSLLCLEIEQIGGLWKSGRGKSRSASSPSGGLQVSAPRAHSASSGAYGIDKIKKLTFIGRLFKHSFDSEFSSPSYNGR